MSRSLFVYPGGYVLDIFRTKWEEDTFLMFAHPFFPPSNKWICRGMGKV